MRAKSAVLGIAAAAALSSAAFSGPALAAACTTAPLSTYLSGGRNATCTVLDKTFSDFIYASTPLNTPTAALVNVIPVTSPTNEPGLTFQGNFSRSASVAPTTGDIDISFHVAAGAGLQDHRRGRDVGRHHDRRRNRGFVQRHRTSEERRYGNRVAQHVQHQPGRQHHICRSDERHCGRGHFADRIRKPLADHQAILRERGSGAGIDGVARRWSRRPRSGPSAQARFVTTARFSSAEARLPGAFACAGRLPAAPPRAPRMTRSPAGCVSSASIPRRQCRVAAAIATI